MINRWCTMFLDGPIDLNDDAHSGRQKMYHTSNVTSGRCVNGSFIILIVLLVRMGIFHPIFLQCYHRSLTNISPLEFSHSVALHREFLKTYFLNAPQTLNFTLNKFFTNLQSFPSLWKILTQIFLRLSSQFLLIAIFTKILQAIWYKNMQSMRNLERTRRIRHWNPSLQLNVRQCCPLSNASKKVSFVYRHKFTANPIFLSTTLPYVPKIEPIMRSQSDRKPTSSPINTAAPRPVTRKDICPPLTSAR